MFRRNGKGQDTWLQRCLTPIMSRAARTSPSYLMRSSEGSLKLLTMAADSRQPPPDLLAFLSGNMTSMALTFIYSELYHVSRMEHGDGYVTVQIAEDFGLGRYVSITMPQDSSITCLSGSEMETYNTRKKA